MLHYGQSNDRRHNRLPNRRYLFISFAPNEACARSAGAGGVIGRDAVGLGASRSINRSIGPGLGWSRFSAHPFRARNFALRRDLRLRRFWFPGVWPDGCRLDGSCYEVPGGAGAV
jgi:hypothetical protein